MWGRGGEAVEEEEGGGGGAGMRRVERGPVSVS